MATIVIIVVTMVTIVIVINDDSPSLSSSTTSSSQCDGSKLPPPLSLHETALYEWLNLPPNDPWYENFRLHWQITRCRRSKPRIGGAGQAPGKAGFRNVRISPEKILIWWASDIPWSPLVSLASFSLASLGTGIPMHQKHGHRFKELQYIVDQRPRDRIKLDRHILSWPNDHHHSAVQCTRAVTVLWYHSPSPPEPFHPRLNDALRWDL